MISYMVSKDGRRGKDSPKHTEPGRKKRGETLT